MIPRQDNPVLHDWPARQLCAYDMHRVLQLLVHVNCTVSTCLMKRYCWDALIQMEHNPTVPMEECLVCDGSMSARYTFPDGTTIWPLTSAE